MKYILSSVYPVKECRKLHKLPLTPSLHLTLLYNKTTLGKKYFSSHDKNTDFQPIYPWLLQQRPQDFETFL